MRAACEGLGAEYLVVKEEGAGRVLHLEQLIGEGQGCSEEVWLHLHCNYTATEVMDKE